MTDHPYAGALAQINHAHALVRRVQPGLPVTSEADPGLSAQLLALEARATIGSGGTTLRWLRDALALLEADQPNGDASAE